MAKAPSSKTQITDTDGMAGVAPGLLAIDRMLDGNGRSLEAWTEMNRMLMERLGAWQAETARFVARRLEDDLSSQRELASCRTPSEALEVYGAFTRRAVQDYMEEAGKVGDIAGAMTRACAAFGESLTAAAMRGAVGSTAGPSAASAVSRAADDARSEIAA